MLKTKLNTNDRWILGENGPIISSVHKDIPNVDTKSITANGTYNASSDNLDGYNQVVVNVPSSVSGTIDITKNANGINVSSYEYANVNVPSPSYVKNPIEFDYNIGYVDKDTSNNYGVWVYESPTNTYSDIYTIENGKTYIIGFGATIDNRARGCLTQTDVRTLGPGSRTTGEALLVGMYSGTFHPGDTWRFTAPFDGYFIFAKSNRGVANIISYFYCIDDMTDAEPSGTKDIVENGDGIDVASYSAVNVHVPGTTPPSGTIQITQNGTGINVAQYATADVQVPGIVPAGTLDILAHQGELTVDVTNYAQAHIGNPLLLYNDAYLQAIPADTSEFIVNYNKDKTISYVSILPIIVDYTKNRSITSYYFKYCNHDKSVIMKIYTYTADGENPAENLLTGSYIPDPVVDSTNGTITLVGRNTSYKWLSGGGFLVIIGYNEYSIN